jgi:hypothetical protein
VERIGLAPGTAIGGYTVVAPLGAGGMGAVYKAVDDGGTSVALKLLHPEIGADPVARARLSREVSALQRLRHPSVARVLDAEADSTEAFLVTELVQGDPLDAWVRHHGTVRGDALVEMATRLMDALDAVHDAGVVHRDLKPSNVMMTSHGPVLIDFGLALGHDDAPLTATSVVAGSPGYLAPELMDGGDPGPDIDWWGWAAVIAYAATGRAPYGTGPLGQVLGRTRSGEVDLEGLAPGTVEALSAALGPDPDERPEPGALVAALVRDVPCNHAAPPVDPDEDDEDLVEDDLLTERLDLVDGQTKVLPMEYRAPVPAPRWGSLGAIGALVVAAGTQYPTIALACVVLGAVLVRAVGSDLETMDRSRERWGLRRRDVPLAVLSAPWHLVLGIAGAFPSAVVASAATIMVGGPLWWMAGEGLVRLTSAGSGEVPVGAGVGAALGGLVLLFTLVVWLGPVSWVTRVGARRTLDLVAPGRKGGQVLVLVALSGAAILLARLVAGYRVTWWPLPAPVLP